MNTKAPATIMPTVNLNGTDGRQLMQAYLDAHTALMAAIEKMQVSRPHGRDYPGEPQFKLLERASDEHERHIRNMVAARTYLMDVALAINAQNAERGR